MAELILFQGDSITDAGRDRSQDGSLGQGYAALAAQQLQAQAPQTYRFYNRACSGDRVLELAARWQEDCLALAPDVVSILVGINDIWHQVVFGTGVDAACFEAEYAQLLRRTRRALPQVRLLLMEPFVLPGRATQNDWEYLSGETTLRAGLVRRLAQRYGAACVSLQPLLDQAGREAGTQTLSEDGVHATPAGHRLLADAWLQAFAQL